MNQKVLKLTVFFLVAVATVKLLLAFIPALGTVAKRQKVMAPSGMWLWGNSHESSSVAKHADSLEAKEEPVKQSFLNLSQKASTEPLRVVHLDLKGAAPKVEYFKQIFPLLSSLGADGILLEYEDMFPYEGELEVIRSPFAYSIEVIEEIKTLAKLNKLELIPLVQVFGHLEFVLKHEMYFHLREMEMFPNSLNPLAPGALPLVEEMLIQVLKRHPEAQWIHIGADEVWSLGESEESKHWLKENGGDVGILFLKHVTAVCLFLSELRSGIKILFWEDMLREMSAVAIKDSNLPNLAFPVLWNYLPYMNMQNIENLLSKYQEAGFSGIWFASAFKGATAVDQMWTPINHHLQNHLSWLKVIESIIQYPSITLQGIALTGWQSEGRGQFAGSKVYYMVRKIHSDLQSSVKTMMQDRHIRGSFSPYNQKYNFASPREIGFFKGNLKKLLDEWETFLESFEIEMKAIFYPDTVEEWMEENVNQHMNKLRTLMQDAERIAKLKGRPKNLNP